VRFQRLGKLDQALELYNKSVEVHSKHFGRDSLRVADKLYNCALLHTTLEHFSEAEAMYNEALQTRERHHGRDSLEVGDVLTGLSALLQHQERLDEAEKLCVEVLRISRLRTGLESLQVAQSLHNLAGIHREWSVALLLPSPHSFDAQINVTSFTRRVPCTPKRCASSR
jgi:tetratricopeptide (TPR) repeat protein